MKKTVKKLVLAKETVKNLGNVTGGLYENYTAAYCNAESYGIACGTFSANDSICCSG